MLGNAFGWPHLVIILVVILLIFGASRLPALARSLGQSTKILKEELKDGKKGDGRSASISSDSTDAAPPTTTESTASSSSSGSGGPENRSS